MKHGPNRGEEDRKSQSQIKASFSSPKTQNKAKKKKTFRPNSEVSQAVINIFMNLFQRSNAEREEEVLLVHL